jgi:hypothetical protein
MVALIVQDLEKVAKTLDENVQQILAPCVTSDDNRASLIQKFLINLVEMF